MTDQPDRRSVLKGAAATAALLAPGAALAQGAGERRPRGDSPRRRCRLRGIGRPHPAMDRAADHRRRAAQHRGGRRSYGPARHRGGLHRRAQGGDGRRARPCSARSTPARGAPSASISCTTSSNMTRRNGRSPPLEGRIFDHALGRAMRGRGAVNQKGPEGAFLAALARLSAPPAGGCRSTWCCSPKARRRSARPISATSSTMPRCWRRCAGRAASSSPRPRRAPMAPSPSTSAPRASSNAS